MDSKNSPTASVPSLHSRHTKALVELKTYKLLVESIEDYAIFHLDPEGYIVSWNKGAERNKGYKAHEIIGQHFSKFYLQHDVDSGKPERELEIVRKVGRIEDEDWRVRKDGSRFWANVIITALRDESGELVGFAKVTRDLTERKQQEDDLRKANVVLRKQREELSALNDSKDEFISLASHQLRTPATAIKQLLGLMLEGFSGGITDEQAALIQKAYESNERQLSIVNSLLNVAQLDAGKVILRKTPTNVNQLIQDVLDEQSDSFNSRQQLLRTDLPMHTLMAGVDPKYFRMALENLVDNASKYTPAEGMVTISAGTDGEDIWIKVSDTGVGIAEEDMKTLFEKFKRVPNELSQKVAGSGLGLYWANEVISLHGGNISVSSAPHQGTTFTIILKQGGIDA